MSGKIDPECLNSRHILINLEVKNDKKKGGKEMEKEEEEDENIPLASRQKYQLT